MITGSEAEDTVRKTGEAMLSLAQEIVKPEDNPVTYYTFTSTKIAKTGGSLRTAMTNYAQQFIGNPYVWGGESLTEGCDCSGFVMKVYEAFGYSLPRTSAEQAEVGTRIETKDAKPGDLIFYARNGTVYHVLMYLGDGKAVNAASTATGIIISNVDYSKAVWACDYIGNTDYTSTQAVNWTGIGKKASEGDTESQKQIIDVLAQAAEKEWNEYGFSRSVIIAQAIQESGWLSFSGTANGGIQSTDNNILGMNAELLNGEWASPWNGAAVTRNVPQSVNGTDVYGFESMRAYADIESCMEDYAAFKIGMHPEMKGVINTDTVINTALAGYATDPAYESSVKAIIQRYNLTEYDE